MNTPKSIDQFPAPAPDYKGKAKRLPAVKKPKTERASKSTKSGSEIINQAMPTSIYTQLAKFQELNIVIPRNGTGKIEGREYKYATLDDTINMTKAPLSALGVTMMQIIQDGKLRTVFFHVNKAGEKSEIFSEIEVPKPNSTQDLGTSITYLRRYTIAPLLGLTSEQDLDAGKGVVPNNVPGVTVQKQDPLPGAAQQLTAQPTEVGTQYTTPGEGIVPKDPTIMDAIADQQKVAPKSEFYNKALGMIKAATSEAALDLIRTQIGRSTNFTDDDKSELYAIVDAKETEVEGTIR